MKAYKGFDKNLQCRGFQYEIGKEFREDTAKLCEKGFHACENPLETFSHYSPGSGSRYCEVELDEVSEERIDGGSKVCAKVIKIGKELNTTEICKAHFEYVKSRCDPEKSDVAGDWGSASAGYYGSAAAGYRGSAAAGEGGSAAAGYYGSAAAGYRGSAAAGEGGSAAAGDRGSAAAGDCGSAAAGENGIACSRGGRVKGGLGSVICASELDENLNNISAAVAIVDGKIIKADTWYVVRSGSFVEADT